MAKQAGDGKPNITREEQRANKTDAEVHKENLVKEHGLDGLGMIADETTPGWRES